GVFDEDRYFQAGVETPVFELGAGGPVLAVNICEDIWYPTGPTTAQTLAGAEVVVSINSSPYHVGKVRFREKMLATRAADHVGYLAFVNLVGGQDELVFDGQSMVFDPAGHRLALGRAFEEDLVVVDLDLDAVFRARLRDSRRRKDKRVATDPVRHVRLPALPERPRPPFEPERPTGFPERDAEVYAALVTGTRDYVRKNGFRRVVVGLSGGIDSALTAAIAVDALGREAVVGVSMPSAFSSAGTRADARRVARNLGIEFLTLPIGPAYRAFRRMLAGPFKGLKEDVAEENVQARVRGTLLMALSNKFGWLVLTTGNKSETGVGYCTLYGDMAGGFAVIKDVPKTMVYALARWRNAREGRPAIPASVLRRPPSAELRPNQTDQDTLPPYEVLDPILEAYVEEDRSREELLAEFDPAVVERAVELVDAAEYK
ncbi:MAG: NAD+ synthase, partial [Chloroflexi bacterium]|nr:NAD+ synthase [Chloroflexota bacterium]